jgi:hypothetical protein
MGKGRCEDEYLHICTLQSRRYWSREILNLEQVIILEDLKNRIKIGSNAVFQNNQMGQKIQKRGTVVSNLDDFTQLYHTFSNKPFCFDRRGTIFSDAGVIFQHAVKSQNNLCNTARTPFSEFEQKLYWKNKNGHQTHHWHTIIKIFAQKKELLDALLVIIEKHLRKKMLPSATTENYTIIHSIPYIWITAVT